MFEIILLIIEQNKAELKTAEAAFALAKNKESQLILVYSMNKPINQQTQSSFLTQITSQCQKDGIRFHLEIKKQISSTIINDLANIFNVDLIVMSTQGVNIQMNRISTVSQVIKLSSCPVLLVP